MNRREFLAGTAAVAGSEIQPHRLGLLDAPASRLPADLDVGRHRFGINYTPSRNWWFCWNDWNADSIKHDLDAIAALGADHLRVLLIWPFFQPNPTWVSPAQVDRLDQLLAFMNERALDALITIFTGQLSGWFFMPPFHRSSDGFYTDHKLWSAQELFVRELARVAKNHSNLIGFDLGNELNTCWTAETAAGDAWMIRMFALMETLLPAHLHVNGVDHAPWFERNTFSARTLASSRLPVMHCYPYWTGALKYGGAMDPPSVKLLAAMATLIRSYAGSQQKPVWAGEFNTCIEQLTETQQARWLEKSVTAAIDSGVGWFSYWDSHDVDRRFEFNPLEYSLGLLTNDGRIKEQGQVFKQLADAFRGKPVLLPTRTSPPPPKEQSADTTWLWLLDWMEWKPRSA